MKILALFVVTFAASMAAIMTLERYPKLRRIYGRRFARLKDEIDETGPKMLGRDLHDRWAFWSAVIASLILAALGTGAAYSTGVLS